MQVPRELPLGAHAAHQSFITGLVINHGPAECLGRFMLAADTAARARGVLLSFAGLDEWVLTTGANSQSWRPLLPVFDPNCGLFAPTSAFCLLGRNDAGEVVVTQAARFFDWQGTTLHEEASSLRLLYREPDAWRREGEAIEVTAASARTITGKVAYNGAH